MNKNGAFSSSIFVDEERTDLPMEYTDYVEKHFIQPIRRLGTEAKILVLGSGGFTLGRNNYVSQITYVDIDPHLKKVVEEEFLKKPLAQKKPL